MPEKPDRSYMPASTCEQNCHSYKLQSRVLKSMCRHKETKMDIF